MDTTILNTAAIPSITINAVINLMGGHVVCMPDHRVLKIIFYVNDPKMAEEAIKRHV